MNQPPQPDPSAPTLEGLDARLKALRERQRKADAQTRAAAMPNTALGRAWRLSVEMVAALLVGLGIGYGIDLALGTRPWFLIAFVVLGVVTGIWNVVKAALQMNAAQAEAAGQQDAQPDDRP